MNDWYGIFKLFLGDFHRGVVYLPVILKQANKKGEQCSSFLFFKVSLAIILGTLLLLFFLGVLPVVEQCIKAGERPVSNY